MYAMLEKLDLRLFCEWWTYSIPLAKMMAVSCENFWNILQKILLESTQNPNAKSTNTFVSHLICVMRLCIPLSIDQYSIFNK